MIKLSHKNNETKIELNLWISKDEIAYLSREGETPKSNIIRLNEKSNPFTLVALKSGRNIMVDQTPEEIITMMTNCKCGK